MKRRDGETRGRGDTEKKPKSIPAFVQSSVELPALASPRLPIPASLRPSAHPSKHLGQNFLVNRGVVDRILNALAPGDDETVIEIGPGQGALTAGLIERAGRVVAVEFDRKLIPILIKQFGSFQNFKLVEGDALRTEFCAEIHPAVKARVVANLPYNISTAILQRLIEQRGCIDEMVLMLQREVVDRITAPPGSTDRGFLTVLIEAYCEVEKLFDVAPGSFRPVPKVWSSVIQLKVQPQIAVEVGDEKLFRSIVGAGFAQRRKTILNNLRNAPAVLQQLIKPRGGVSIILCEANIQPQRRAETLTIAEWLRLARLLA